MSNMAQNTGNAASYATGLMRQGMSNMAYNTGLATDLLRAGAVGGVNLYLRATDPMSLRLEQAARSVAHQAYGAMRHRNRGIMQSIQDSQDLIQSLRQYVREHRNTQGSEASLVRRPMWAKQSPSGAYTDDNLRSAALGPGQFEIRNADDSDHAYMSFDDVDGWMGSTQNKDDLIQNLFKRPGFKAWLEKTYGSVDEGRVYRSLREFDAETLATMLIVLDHHS
jgi:hypothetical protein